MSVKKLICNEVARCQPASLRKKLFHASSFMYFTLIFSECFTITSSKEALKVCTHNFIQRNVVLLVIYLFHHDSSKSLSSRQEVFCEKGVLRNFTKFAGKHLCQSLFFNKVAGLRPQVCNFIKRETLAQMFSCEFRKISKNTFCYRTPPVAASVLWNLTYIFHFF